MTVRLTRPNNARPETRRASGKRFSGTSTATAPLPVSATWNAGFKFVRITFDSELAAGTTDASQYRVIVAGKLYSKTGTGTVSGSEVTIGYSSSSGVALGPNRVEYTPSPGDLFGLVGGAPVAGFSQVIT